jgi:hypothetical protein
MECPKCYKNSTILVTKDAPRDVVEQRGLLLAILLLPFDLLRWLWRLLFGRKQAYDKKPYWHCNYCQHDWENKPEPN